MLVRSRGRDPVNQRTRPWIADAFYVLRIVTVHSHALN